MIAVSAQSYFGTALRVHTELSFRVIPLGCPCDGEGGTNGSWHPDPRQADESAWCCLTLEL
jgi:hypothetical protein